MRNTREMLVNAHELPMRRGDVDNAVDRGDEAPETREWPMLQKNATPKMRLRTGESNKLNQLKPVTDTILKNEAAERNAQCPRRRSA